MDSDHKKPKMNRELFNMKLAIHVENSKKPKRQIFQYIFCQIFWTDFLTDFLDRLLDRFLTDYLTFF